MGTTSAWSSDGALGRARAASTWTVRSPGFQPRAPLRTHSRRSDALLRQTSSLPDAVSGTDGHCRCSPVDDRTVSRSRVSVPALTTESTQPLCLAHASDEPASARSGPPPDAPPTDSTGSPGVRWSELPAPALRRCAPSGRAPSRFRAPLSLGQVLNEPLHGEGVTGTGVEQITPQVDRERGPAPDGQGIPAHVADLVADQTGERSAWPSTPVALPSSSTHPVPLPSWSTTE